MISCAVFLEPNEGVRVRRCLQFGEIDAPLKKTRIQSPSKVSFTPKELKTSYELLAEFTTPSKATGMFSVLVFTLHGYTVFTVFFVFF
jgi:hypothetical protein